RRRAREGDRRLPAVHRQRTEEPQARRRTEQDLRAAAGDRGQESRARAAGDGAARAGEGRGPAAAGGAAAGGRARRGASRPLRVGQQGDRSQVVVLDRGGRGGGGGRGG